MTDLAKKIFRDLEIVDVVDEEDEIPEGAVF